MTGGTLPLATLSPSKLSTKHDLRIIDASSIGNPGESSYKVSIEKLHDSSIKIYAKNIPDGFYKELKFFYRVSNRLPLSKEDARILKNNIELGRLDFNPGPVVSHTILFSCDSLEILAEYSNTDIWADIPSPKSNDEVGRDNRRFFENVQPLVERPEKQHETLIWCRDDGEEKRCLVSENPMQDTGTSTRCTLAQLSVDAPRVNFRYSLMFEPGLDGVSLNDEHSRLSSRILKACRNSTDSRIGASIEDEIKRVFFEYAKREEPELVDEDRLNSDGKIDSLIDFSGEWTAFLWDGNFDSPLLKPAFGNFPVDTWKTAFGYGEGLAGHAFRQSIVSAWRKDRNSRQPHDSNLIFVGNRYKYEWLLAVPILVSTTTGPSIGVISFSAYSNDSDETALWNYYSDIVDETQSQLTVKQQQICSWVNLGFWEGILNAHKLGNFNLSKDSRKLVGSILEEHMA